MPKSIGLLRGINVGGKNRIKMAELRDALTDCGLKDVQTYIQSGNLVFDSMKSDEKLEQLISECIEEEWGYVVPVLVRPVAFLKKVVRNNPFPDLDPKPLCVTILGKKPARRLVDSIPPRASESEHVTIKGDVIYLYCPDGYRNTKLTNGFFEKHFSLKATSRNWKTVNAMLELSKP